YGLVIFFACIAVKYYVLQRFDWWWCYFFPLWNLGYFTLGLFIYWFCKSSLLSQLRRSVPILQHVIPPAIILLFFSFGTVDLESNLKGHLLFLLCFCPMVALAFSDKSSGLDGYLGNI